MRKGRKKKTRYISHVPKVLHFSPRGRQGRPDTTEISYDEYEAIRLVECQQLNQTQAANEMGISRPSLGRILRKARREIASAIVMGKSLHIRMGEAQVGIRNISHHTSKAPNLKPQSAE